MLLFVVNFGALLQLNVKLALISIIAVPFVVVASFFFFRRITKAYQAYQEQDAILSTTLQENLSGVRVVKAFAQEKREAERFKEANRHNLLVNMLSDPASVTEETVDIQAECVRRARFNSRKVSAGGKLLGDLARLTCRIRVLWGERDDTPFRPANLLIGEIREAVGALDLHRIPGAGHWSAYENADEVNRLMLEFFGPAV